MPETDHWLKDFIEQVPPSPKAREGTIRERERWRGWHKDHLGGVTAPVCIGYICWYSSTREPHLSLPQGQVYFDLSVLEGFLFLAEAACCIRLVRNLFIS